ncbi:MAG: DNA-3-methyladenine glycosylase I [Facklamia hominis]
MNQGIIRHRGKIEASIKNAQAFLQVQADYGSFDHFIWSFTQGQVVERQPGEELAKWSDLSDQVTKVLKTYGFKYIGSVTIYSYLQAIGVINDHDWNCSFR